jgi:hypothetical protein
MSAELEVYEEPHAAVPANLFGAAEPEEVVAKASSVASTLAEVIRKQKLASQISGREHVRVEGWTLLGSMLGVFPVVVWTRKLDNGWEARVEARTRDGSVIGAAEAECLTTEKLWSKRDDYALRSMAQTRATSKALRGPLGFVMTLAGFDATPAEEMPRQPAGPSKAEKMRGRIVELAGDDLEQVKTVAHLFFGTPFEQLEEEELASLGTDVRLWVENGKQGEFSVTPF